MKYSFQDLRNAIEIEMQKTINPVVAANIAMSNLKDNPEYYKMQKAKYIKRYRKGNKWVYVYPNDKTVKGSKKVEEKIKLKMRFNSHELIHAFESLGYSYRLGDKPTNPMAISEAENFEENIFSFDKEHTAVIDENGLMLFSKTGKYDVIEFELDEIEKIRSSEILTHSHPEDKSFSVEDIFLGLSLGVKEMRVKTPQNTYFFRISHKQQSDDKIGLPLLNRNRRFMDVLINTNEHVLSIMRQKVNEGVTKQKDAGKEHREIFWNMIQNSPLLTEIFNIEYGKVQK